MGQFKPMVKMMTTEPSVILKLKKGGKVKMADGGFMPMQSTMPEEMPTAMPTRMPPRMPARGGMMAAASPKKPSMAERRRAMNPNLLMKKGGMAEDKSQDKAMIKKAFKQHDMQEHKGDKGTSLKLKKGGMMKGGMACADGGEIDKNETKTTIKGNAGKFLNTKMNDGDKTDKAHGTKGIKEKNSGGYKMGGTIEGNAGKFLNTKVVDGDKTDKAHGTKGIKEQNAGGYKMGGNVNWENRPANTSKAGKSNGTTGGVKEANGGGYKMGGSTKKAYATGGKVDDGKAQAMPKKPMSRPVANSLQSGTFKKGGKVNKFSTGDSVIDRETSRMESEKAAEKRSNEAMREGILGAPKRAYDAVKGMFGSTPKPAGSVTETQKSVTVAPSKKRGGMMC